MGNERSQLRTVIGECVSAAELREYLESDKSREEHFTDKKTGTKYHKLPIQNKNVDLRNDVADRIYDIRCRIVHTKNDHADDELKMILPFSDDADFLIHDIDLIEFIAQKVLISSSAELV